MEPGDWSVAFIGGLFGLTWGSAAIGLLILGVLLMTGGLISMYVKITNIEANTTDIADSLNDLHEKVIGVDDALRTE